MPRTESRTRCSIWNNADFIALRGSAQRLYWLLYSQSTISLCGVIALTPGRWSRLAPDTPTEEISADLELLAEFGFIVVDVDTEEVFVRAFMDADGVWKSPKTRGVAIESVKAVLSSTIRQAAVIEITKLSDETKPQENTLFPAPISLVGNPIPQAEPDPGIPLGCAHAASNSDSDSISNSISAGFHARSTHKGAG